MSDTPRPTTMLDHSILLVAGMLNTMPPDDPMRREILQLLSELEGRTVEQRTYWDIFSEFAAGGEHREAIGRELRMTPTTTDCLGKQAQYTAAVTRWFQAGASMSKEELVRRRLALKALRSIAATLNVVVEFSPVPAIEFERPSQWPSDPHDSDPYNEPYNGTPDSFDNDRNEGDDNETAT